MELSEALINMEDAINGMATYKIKMESNMELADIQYIDEAIDKISMAKENIRNHINKQTDKDKIYELSDNLKEALDLIESNAKLISGSKGMRTKLKTKQTGELHPSYISELDTNELINLYSQAGNKLTKDIVEHYNKEYGITYQGLRERLIRAGAWVGR